MSLVRLLACGLAASAIAVGGTSAAAAQPIIVNPDGSGSVPWQVALVDAANPDLFTGQFCGGTIRDTLHVITAAHCVQSPHDQPGTFDILAGITDLTAPESTVQRRKVTAVAVDPDFAARPSGALLNDAALLTLDAPLQLSNAVDVMPPVEVGGTGAKGEISGWGANDVANPGVFPTTLQFATIDILPDSACANYGADFDPAVMLCAGRLAGSKTVDTCHGDSGGPLTRVTGTDPVDGAALSDKLLGIVSWGLGNGDAGCGDPTLPGVYTRVSDPKINAFLSQ